MARVTVSTAAVALLALTGLLGGGTSDAQQPAFKRTVLQKGTSPSPAARR